MALGDSASWRGRFVSLDKRILERLAVVYPKVVQTLGFQPEEDEITINLVNELMRDMVVRRVCHWIEYQFEPIGLDEAGAAFSKGKIDMAILLDQARENYLAYECKRLNVKHNGKRSSLATPYVKEGVNRFITEQYAKDLPVACMLGYVLDGDVDFASIRVKKSLNKEKDDIFLTSGPIRSLKFRAIETFITWHQRPISGSEIELRHALLPFIQPGSD